MSRRAGEAALAERYRSRSARWRRWIEPPAPLVMNPREPRDFPLGRWNLYLGGAGRLVDGYVNLDIVAMPGVDVVADAERLPFGDARFTRVECDAVLEHVLHPELVMAEIDRVLAPGGYAHVVTPFCHPFHAYPHDYRRLTPAAIRLLAPTLEPVAEGWRTGPAATMLVFTLEFFKLLLPWRWWRGAVHIAAGWLLFPLRYLDLIFLRGDRANVLGNHCYVWLRKPLGAKL